MDAIEAILTLIYVLLHVRVVLCVAATMAFAFLLGPTDWVSVAQVLIFAFSGLLPGVAWQAMAEARTTPAISAANRRTPASATEPTPTSGLAQYLTALLCGATWGAASSQSWRTMVFGAVVLALCGALWHHHAVVLRRWLEPPEAVGLLWATALSYLAMALIVHGT